MANQIIKKEDNLTFKGGFLKNKKGSLVLTRVNIYFMTAKGERSFDIPVSEITSINTQKGVGSGVDHLYILYTHGGADGKVKIEHFSFMSSGLGLASRLSQYFSSWEQMINDARFGRLG
jgi:hypothetical protein